MFAFFLPARFSSLNCSSRVEPAQDVETPRRKLTTSRSPLLGWLGPCARCRWVFISGAILCFSPTVAQLHEQCVCPSVCVCVCDFQFAFKLQHVHAVFAALVALKERASALHPERLSFFPTELVSPTVLASVSQLDFSPLPLYGSCCCFLVHHPFIFVVRLQGANYY